MSDKHNQELLNALTQAFAEENEGGVHIINLSDLLQDSEETLITFDELAKLLAEGETTTGLPEEEQSITTKSQFAAYSYDKTTPVPLPPSITTETHAVQYMEKQGYTHFEVYRKLGTYKAETKTEMVRQ